MKRAASNVSLCMMGVLWACHSAQAQSSVEGAAEPPAAQAPADFKFAVGGGLIYQFDTDVDRGGEFNVTRLSGAFDTEIDVDANLNLSLRMTYALDSYDFGGGGGVSAAEPWDDIHTAAAGLLFTWRMDQQWTTFFGPVIQSARESGADFDDGITGGGVIGATYIASRELIVGGGLVITSQIEDDVRVSPIIIVNWGLGESWRVSSRTTGNILTRTGAELVYVAHEKWEFAFGLANYYSRFRLDDDGPAPDGVGEDESLPIWLRATYRPNDSLRIEAIGGMALGGQLRLEDEDGDFIAEEDYDAAPFLGIFAHVQF